MLYDYGLMYNTQRTLQKGRTWITAPAHHLGGIFFFFFATYVASAISTRILSALAILASAQVAQHLNPKHSHLHFHSLHITPPHCTIILHSLRYPIFHINPNHHLHLQPFTLFFLFLAVYVATSPYLNMGGSPSISTNSCIRFQSFSTSSLLITYIVISYITLHSLASFLQ